MIEYKKDFRSNLKKARNYGSAKDGTSHWWMQRVTSLVLIPLSVWFVILIMQICLSSKEELFLIVKSPLNIILLIVFISTSIYHGLLGLKVIIEDYVHNEAWKLGMIIITQIISYLTIISGICAILAYHFLSQI